MSILCRLGLHRGKWRRADYTVEDGWTGYTVLCCIFTCDRGCGFEKRFSGFPGQAPALVLMTFWEWVDRLLRHSRSSTFWERLDRLLHHSRPSTVYLAGPMTGYEYANFPAFDAARDLLQSRGFIVFSPADEDRKVGMDPLKGKSPPGYYEHEPTRWRYNRSFMQKDLKLVSEVDFVYFLKGWEKSRGARAEYAAACFYRDLCGHKPGLMFEPGAAMGLDFTPMSLTVNPSNADINAIAAGILAKVASDPKATAKDLDGQLVVSVSALVQSVNVTFDNGTYSVGITHTDGQDVTLTASVNF